MEYGDNYTMSLHSIPNEAIFFNIWRQISSYLPQIANKENKALIDVEFQFIEVGDGATPNFYWGKIVIADSFEPPRELIADELQREESDDPVLVLQALLTQIKAYLGIYE